MSHPHHHSNDPRPCRGCGKPVVWVFSSKSGKKIPLDMDLPGIPEHTKPKGALFFVHEDRKNATPIERADAILETIRVKSPETIEVLLHGHDELQEIPVNRIGISHFKTCTEAERF